MKRAIQRFNLFDVLVKSVFPILQIGWLLLSTVAGWAEPSSPSALAPILIKKTGQPLRAQWSDGREAQLESTEPLNQYLTYKFSVYENTCAIISNPDKPCLYHAGLSSTLFRWVWTKNPQNTDRVGKTLEIKYGQDGFTPFQSIVQAGVLNHFNKDFSSEKTPLDQMTCDDWDWLKPYLPQATSLLSPIFSVQSWAVEIMVTNPETGENENRTFFNYFDVQLSYNKQLKTLTLQQVGDSVALTAFNSFLFIGDVVHWSLRSSSHQQCTLAFKPDFGEIGKQVEKAQKDLPSRLSFPYKYTNDKELAAISNFSFNGTITNFLDYANNPYPVR